MLRKWFCQAEITIEIHPVDPVLVKSGYATFSGPDMVPVQTLRDGEETFYLPGTSLKGVLRSHLERICRSLKEGVTCLPYYFDAKKDAQNVPVASEQGAISCGKRLEGDRTTAEIYRLSCPACRVFGSLKFKGRAGLSDAYALPDHKPVREDRNNVCIDRFTGGVAQGPFDMTVLVGGVYRTTLQITNFELWQLAGIHFLLADLEDGLLSVGSGQSRGLGRVEGKATSYRLTYLQKPPRLCGLFQFATAEERQAYGLSAEPGNLPELPSPKSSRGLRTVYDVTGEWQNWTETLAGSFPAFLDWFAENVGPLASQMEVPA